MMGLTPGSYEAYCFDQAVWFFGITVEGELEKAGRKPQKGEGALISARTGVLKKYLGSSDVGPQFADPAAMFK